MHGPLAPLLALQLFGHYIIALGHQLFGGHPLLDATEKTKFKINIVMFFGAHVRDVEENISQIRGRSVPAAGRASCPVSILTVCASASTAS